MNTDIPENWPIVERDVFERTMDTFNYWREGWSNAIEYRDNDSGRLIGVEVDRPHHYRLHPGLAAELDQA